MPKLKSLEPLQTEPFKIKIKKIKYFEFESKNKYAPPKSWIANCNCLIVKGGKESKNKSFCNAQIYLTEQEYNDKILEKNDIILLNDKITWEVKKGISFKTYKPEKLKDINAQDIKKDANGKPYAEDFIYPYIIKAKQDTWKIFEKNDEYFIANVGNENKLKLSFDTKKEIEDFSDGDFYLSKEEYDMLVADNHSAVKFCGYAHKVQICSKQMTLDLSYDETINKYIMKLTEIKGE